MTRTQMVDLQVQHYERSTTAANRALWGQDPAAKERRAQRLAQGAARRHAVVWDGEESVYVGRWS